jgi:hypothetical protein
VEQLREIGYLDEETIFPAGEKFEQLKQELLQWQHKQEEGSSDE